MHGGMPIGMLSCFKHRLFLLYSDRKAASTLAIVLENSGMLVPCGILWGMFGCSLLETFTGL